VLGGCCETGTCGTSSSTEMYVGSMYLDLSAEVGRGVAHHGQSRSLKLSCCMVLRRRGKPRGGGEGKKEGSGGWRKNNRRV
jgi:hypothetical protein